MSGACVVTGAATIEMVLSDHLVSHTLTILSVCMYACMDGWMDGTKGQSNTVLWVLRFSGFHYVSVPFN